MSYSFNIRAACKATALAAVAIELDKVAEQQPIHAVDRVQAEAAAEAFVALVREPREGEELSVSVNGSVAVSVYGESDDLTHASVGVNVAILAKTG